MNPQQLLFILRSRRKLALWVFLGTLSLGLLITWLMPRQYLASTSLVLDIRPDPIAGALLPGMASPGYITTQLDIIQSERVATRVVRLLRLAQNPTAVANWKDATDEKVSLENYYGKLLQRGLNVEPARGSNVVHIGYASSDPQFAAAAANAFAQAYVDVNVELRVEPARQYAAWFDERLKTLRANLEAAQTRLSSYQQEKGIVASNNDVDYQAARLAALTAQLAEAEGQRADTASRAKNTGSEVSPDVMVSPIVIGLKSDIAKAEARRQELDSMFGSNHPLYRQAQAQIAGLRQQLNAEIARISGGATSANAFSTQKEAELKAAIAAHKAQLLRQQAERDTIAVLARDVDSAQRAYDAVAQRISLTQLESQMQQNNVSILSPAIEPDEPARPRVLLNVIASLFLGALFAVGAALGLEKLDQRVRNPADLRAVGGVPLLGVLATPPVRGSLREHLAAWRAFLRRRRMLPPPAAPAEGA